MSAPKILVPVDGSAASLRAVDFAIEMVALNPATSLVLLHVQNIPAIELADASDAMATNWLQEAASQTSAKALKDAIGKSEGRESPLRRSKNRTDGRSDSAGTREEDVKHIVTGRAVLALKACFWALLGRGSNHADQVDGHGQTAQKLKAASSRPCSASPGAAACFPVRLSAIPCSVSEIPCSLLRESE